MRLLANVPALLLLVAIACGPAPVSPPAPAAGTPQTGSNTQPAAERRSANQVIRIAQVGLPANMSPISSASNTNVYGLMYDSLTVLDKSFNVQPGIADKWDTVNPTTWRYTLRKDVTFSNGDKLTADDVTGTWAVAVEKKFPGAAQLGQVAEFKKVDDYTVDMVLKQPDASMHANLGFLWILPRKYIDQVGIDAFVSKPIGSGPYELRDYRAGDIARFALRSTAHPFRKASATEIEVRSLPEFTSISAGLRNGEIDIAIGQFSGDQVGTLRSTDLTFQKTFVYNINGAFPKAEMDQRNTPTKDIRVRLALNYAIDKEAIARQFYKGEALVAGQVGLPDTPFWDPNLKPFPFDPAKAKQLLTEAGYPNGLKLQNGIEFTAQTVNPDVMAAVQGYLRDVGVEVSINAFELAAFLDKFYGRNGQTKGDIWVTALGDGNGFNTLGRTLYGCANQPNWWCNAEFDQLTAQAASESDVAKRTEILRKAAQAMVKDASHIYLLVVPTFAISNPKVKGLVYPGTSARLTDGVYRVD